MAEEFLIAISVCCHTAGVGRGARLIVACSGGSDSMALTLLAQRFAKQHNVTLTAVTVDHGLRPESAIEAQRVGTWLEGHDIAHHILRWEGKKPASNRQEAAREARYRLLADYAKAQDAQHIMVAHTQDDQAETFLLRLMRGSGVDGLAAMAPVSQMHDVTLLRPLLGFSRMQLQEYLGHRGQDFIHDPSNDDVRYDRVRMRRVRPVLAEVGIDDERLASTARNMARARDFLTVHTRHFLQQHAQFFPHGYAELSHAALTAHDEIMLRVLSAIVMKIGGQRVPLRLEENERLLAALRSPDFKGATLAGVVIAPRKEALLFYRELRGIEKDLKVPPHTAVVWDKRFRITHHTKTALYVGPLLQDGWLEFARRESLTCTVPSKKILYTLPALRTKTGHIVAVPHLHGNELYTIAVV